MSVVDTGYLPWPRKRPFTRPSHEVWRPAQAVIAEPGPELADRADPIRTLTFYAALALVFVKFGFIAEIQSTVLHFNLYLLYIFGIPAVLGLVLSGGLHRAMAGRPAYYWTAFNVWMFLCVPTSDWRMGSFLLAKNYVRDNLLLMLIIAGLVVSWRECQLLIRALGAASVVGVLAGRVFSYYDDGGRLSLSFSGTVGNANDYAAHLLLALPILLIFVYNSKSRLMRFIAMAAIGYGLLLIVKTASRGALVAIGVSLLYYFFRAGAVQRMVLLCLVPIGVIAVLLVVPSRTLTRIVSFSSSEQDVSQEAMESSDARRYVLRKGIEYTLEFPIFGVGPGQFPGYEGSHNKVYGSHGMWHQAHNAWVQTSSECGIPGAIFLVAGYISTFLMLNQVYRKANRRSDCRDIRNMVFCLMLGMVAFCTAITFLNFAYLFYGPALAGIAIVIRRAANYEFAHRGNGLTAEAPGSAEDTADRLKRIAYVEASMMPRAGTPRWQS